MNAAIATHLNVAQQAIVKIEEWKHVLFVVVRGIGARFVSKKAIAPMKVEVKGAHLPTVHVGSKSFRFSKGSQGTAIKHSGLEGWKVETCGSFSIFDLSAENRLAIFTAVEQWLQNKQTIEFAINHDWKQVREENLKALGVQRKTLEYEMYNSNGKYYG